MIRRTLPTIVDLHVDLILPQRLYQVREIVHFARQVYAARRSGGPTAVDREVVAAEGVRAGTRL